MLASLLLACAPPTAASTETAEPYEGLVLNANVLGVGEVDLRIEDGLVVEMGQLDGEGVDMGGQILVPAFIDSHVHLAYWDVAEQLAANGVAAAVDLAAPIGSITTAAPSNGGMPLEVLWSGPMVTATNGYPTQSWGSNGYGIECADEAAARQAVRDVHAAGARVIKVPMQEPLLSDAALRGVADEAHDLGLLVATHALSDDMAAKAALVGFDVLAHTPTGALSDDTVKVWSDKSVVTSLSAFGGSGTTIDNLRRLHEAGATVVYGTDLGNTRTPAIDPWELSLMEAAGLDGAEILHAGTAAPAALWGIDQLGTVEVGHQASWLVLPGDPRLDPAVLASPAEVWMRGVQMEPTTSAR